MNSRERVRAVLDHRMPDRVPNALGGCETAGLHISAYERLQRVLGAKPCPPRIDTFMTNAVFEEDVIRAMEGDIILLASPNMCKSPLRGNHADQWKQQALWGKTYSVSIRDHFRENHDGSITWETADNTVCPPGSFYFDKIETTDLTAEFDVPDPDDFHPADTLSDELLRHLEKEARRLYEETDFSICLGESIRDLQIAPGGMIGSMVLMMEEPEIMGALLEKCADAGLKQIAQLHQAVGKYVDILSIAHDFGDNRGVLIGAPLWRKIYKPAYQRFFTQWRKITDMRVNLHSCGSIYEILPDLIECGVEIINPVQTSAADMDAAGLKQKFGRDLIFWGGAYDAQLIDEKADEQTVYQKVYENIKILGKDGGFFFSGVHNLPANLPEHHIRAMLNAWKDARNY